MPDIVINGIRLDPTARQMVPRGGERSEFVLVQIDGPLNGVKKAALEDAGLTILEAVEGNSFICHFTGDDIAPLRRLGMAATRSRAPSEPIVTYASSVPTAMKVSPAFYGRNPGTRGVPVDEASKQLATPLAGVTLVCVTLHQNVPAGRAVPSVAAAARVPQEAIEVRGNLLFLRLDLANIMAIANLAGVRSIDPMPPLELATNTARRLMRVPARNPVPGTGAGGEGEVVTVADTGLDVGKLTGIHTAFWRTDDGDRVVAFEARGRADTGDCDDPHGHGTLVAASVLGFHPNDQEGVAGENIQGTAPRAKLVIQSVYRSRLDQLEGVPHDLGQLFIRPYREWNSRIHTNSWGAGTATTIGTYSPRARSADRFVYEHRDFLVCFAAGNGGVGKDGDGSIWPPATAKNCLTVGASESHRKDFPSTPQEPKTVMTWGNFKDDPPEWVTPSKFNDPVADDPETLAAFSSRGPTNKGRIKPDVVAPGTAILSARSQVTQSEGWALFGTGNAYMFTGGTSLATPLVAGCAATVRAFLRTKPQPIANPSAALVKAALINGAQELKGSAPDFDDAGGPIPNHHQGFGRVDVQAVIGPYEPGEEVEFLDEDQARAVTSLDAARTTHGRAVTVPAGSKCLKVTLVWTDSPGEALANDLDLVVRAGGTERHGNMPSAPPAAAAAFDRVNNVEQVTWNGVPPGEATIEVRAHSTTELQTFALVIRLIGPAEDARGMSAGNPAPGSRRPR